ncbi:6560_t:CDS:2 [Racocetra fulgida]|uniref:6560_t:CDS:1 n=1 Tax=Racocetra fulgida TaxID=60492 RepID=A0A9N8WP48_9GLOM|nr:6560_t:CDS:2 [Racocetra fulgida]
MLLTDTEASTSNSTNSSTSTPKKMKISDISTGVGQRTFNLRPQKAFKGSNSRPKDSEQSKRLISGSQNELEQSKRLISKQSALPVSPARPPFNIEPFKGTPPPLLKWLYLLIL